jgi:diacylglycerol kinase family enzyme
MDDVNRHEVDTRLRETLRPPTAVIDRVLAGALARQHSREPAHRWRWAGVTAAALSIAALVIWQRAAPREPAVPVTTVSRDASMLVVQSSDGRRWLFTPPAAHRRSGHYVIVVPE